MLQLDIRDGEFYQGDALTYTARAGFPHADERLRGLLLNHRVVNGIFDDYGSDGGDRWSYPDTSAWDPDRNTTLFCAAMPRWREHGVIAFTIGLQGGNPFASSPPPEGNHIDNVDMSAFLPDGSLRPEPLRRLARILDQAKALDMVPIVNYFYQGAIHRIRENALEAAIDNATNWLMDRGLPGFVVDLANECGSPRYPDALSLPRIHRLLHYLRDTVDWHNERSGRRQRVSIGTSLLPSYCAGVKSAEIPDAVFRAVDLLLPHGNKRSSDEIRTFIETLRGRAFAVTGRQLPIVFNEDIQDTPRDPNGDNGGDLDHLEVCLEAHASWGNLIRSHQRVPCAEWFDGTDAQREWFAATRHLAGEPKAPSSVLKFYQRL